MSIAGTVAAWDIRHVDLSVPHPVCGPHPRPLFVVFWWRTLPLGAQTYLPAQLPLDAHALAALTADLAATQLAARLPVLGGPARATFDAQPVLDVAPAAVPQGADLLQQLDHLAEAPPASAAELAVVICTRDRPDALATCLAALADQESPPGQVVVVDNSRDGNARPVAEAYGGVRWVHEPRPGLSVARNTGIRHSQGSLVAFTDDDVTPHPRWTAELVRAFADPAIDAVTGLVLPAELATAAQCFFQFEMGGFGGGFVPMVFDGRFFAEACPDGAQVWRIGAGANMAFRRAAFERIGRFDERLGAGAAGCSEDSELWYRLLAHGGTCRLEPRAVVFHRHRAEWAALRRQIRAYMKGHVAALFVQAARFGHRGNRVRVFRQLPAGFIRTAFCAIRDGEPRRLQLLGDEVAGWLAGLRYAFLPHERNRSTPVQADPAEVPAGAGARR